MQYKIKKGDTLSAISRKLGISVKDLAEANNIKDVNKIQAGASLTIPQPKKKKASTVERVIPEEKKEVIKPKKKKKQKKIVEKKREPILPINVRQFLNPYEDRTAEDLSTKELDALKEVVARSQTSERIAEKKAQGLDPNLIEYKDYETTSEGSQYTDVDKTSNMSVRDLASKIQNPYYNLKTFLGQATVVPQEGGGYRVVDTFDFAPETQATGLQKIKEYYSTIPEAGFNPYAQLRNFMGYFGPQEGTGQGGRSNINLSAIGGQTRYNFNKGGSMNIQEQTKNVAAQGRYGDSMLLHVNPAEVKGLAQAMPITVNPQTGQPEAFLPFIAPIAGSLIGSSLAGGAAASALGLGGLSSLAMGALGSGLAQTAVTGDLKQGMLAGLTGYGIGSALQGAAGAAGAGVGSDIATKGVTEAGRMGTEAGANAIARATQQAGAEAAATAAQSSGIQNLSTAFGNPTVSSNVVNPLVESALAPASFGGEMLSANAFTGAPVGGASTQFGSGMGNLMQGLTQPSAYIPMGIGMGGTSIIQSQEEFARQEAERQAQYDADRAEMYRNAPEPILYSANGGVTNFRRGGRSEDDDYTGGNLPQIFAPDRQAYQVNPDFMAGFAPETMYFNPSTVSAPASNLTRGGPPAGVDTYEGSKGGFGGMQASIAPQVSIDPFAAYTGPAPEGMKFTDVAPPPPTITPPITPPDGPPITPPIVPPYDPPFDFPINIPGIGGIGGGFGGLGNINLSGLADLDFSGIDFSQFNPNIKEQIDTGIGQDFMIKPPLDVPGGGLLNEIPDGRNFSIQRPDEMISPIAEPDFGMINMPAPGEINEPFIKDTPPPVLGGGPALDISAIPEREILQKPIMPPRREDFMSIDRLPDDRIESIGMPVAPIDTGIPPMPNEIGVPFTPPVSIAPPAMQEPMPVLDAPQPMPIAPQPIMQQPMPDAGMIVDDRDFRDSVGITPPPVNITGRDELIQGGFMPQPVLPQLELPTTPVSIPAITSPVMPQMPVDLGMIPAPSVNLPLPQTRIAGRPSPRAMARGRAEGGDTLKDIPADNKGLPNLPESVRNEMGFKQAGGETEVDPLITEVTAFILGESDNNEALNAFIQKYGNEAFMQLREQILQSLVPNAQTEGQIQGDGNGGMDDDLFGRIGNKERIAVSQDEFIVPADVVSMLGDGSSDAGSKELYDMMDRVRKEKTGTTKQAPRLANAGGLLPA